ncbi:N-acetylneuraminate synthase family protein [Chloroflexota bacterium]
MNRPIAVAEIGINHNGDLGIAESLIALAKNFGCDFVKFQKRTVDMVYGEEFLGTRRISKWGTTQREQKEGLEFGKEEYDKIDSYCKELGIKWFASAWDYKSVEFLMQYDIPYLKVASACITDSDLLERIKPYNIPVILSTGMSNKEQIDKALDYLGNQVEYLLHCTSTYPTPDKDMNMKGLWTLKELYGDKYKIGFSNHSMKIIYTVQAYVMGAEMLEFHITLDRNMEGSDQAASIGPVGLDRIMKHINSIHDGWGDGEIKCLESEIPVMNKLRKMP